MLTRSLCHVYEESQDAMLVKKIVVNIYVSNDKCITELNYKKL